jgi:phosphatidylglycerol---prolipoprotein diacylglyceryl transferase
MPDLTFTLIIGLGATLGLAWAVQRASTEHAGAILNAGLAALLGAYLGGRLVYLAINRTFFLTYPDELVQFPIGGFTWVGALAGGFIGLILFALFTHQSPGFLADNLLPLFGILALSAWLGCWLVGCAYGAPVDAWWGLPARDEWGNFIRRWPVQVVGALLSVGVLWIVDRLPIHKLPLGTAFTLGTLGISMTIFFMSLLRADPAPRIYHLRLDTWVSLAFGTTAILMLAFLIASARRINKRKSDPNFNTPEPL